MSEICSFAFKVFCVFLVVCFVPEFLRFNGTEQLLEKSFKL